MNTKFLPALAAALVAVYFYKQFYSLQNISNRLRVQNAIAKDIVMQGSQFENQQVGKYVEKIRALCAWNRPGLASEKTGWSMAWMHLVVWNSWKSTYFYADKFSPDDFANYRDYAVLSFQFLVEHHDAEETALFPTVEQKIPGSMVKNHEQHESFLEPLKKVLEYLKTSTKDTFSATELRSQIDALLEPVMQHLAEELDSLEPAYLLSKFTEAELADLNQATHIAQRQNSDNKKSLPFILQNLPPGAPFPPAPGFVRTIVGPYMLYWRYKGLWKYTAYPWSKTLPQIVPVL